MATARNLLLLVGALAFAGSGAFAGRATAPTARVIEIRTPAPPIAAAASAEREAREALTLNAHLSEECEANDVPDAACPLFLLPPFPGGEVECGASHCSEPIGQVHALVFPVGSGTPCGPTLASGAWEAEGPNRFRCVPAS
jgi:hypothetical protein